MNNFSRKAFFTFAMALLANGIASAQDAQPSPDEPQVQARGPVHEAFARPGDVSAPTPIVAKEPPAPIKELPPLQRPDGDNVQWIPGYWAYDDEAKDFLWLSGTWRVTPPGRQWVPGSWNKVKDGFQWQHGFWAPTDPGGVKPIDSMPPGSLEVGPSSPAPNVDSYYTPGQWVFQGDEWIWQPGSWAPNSGNMIYVPPAYLPNQNNNGSLYVPGYWDYPVQDRGLLFAPVAFGGGVYPGNYRPGYTVGINGLLGSLFIRPNTGSYYFGNYYGNNYRAQGYTPWTNYTRRGYDPLLNYYAWSNRGTQNWNANLSSLYAGRLNGSLPVPASTYAQQLRANPNVNATLITSNTANFTRNVSVSPVNSLQTVHLLSQTQAHHVRLTNATPADLATRTNFATRQTISTTSFSSVQNGLRTPTLSSPPLSGLRAPVSLPSAPVNLPSQQFNQPTIRYQTQTTMPAPSWSPPVVTHRVQPYVPLLHIGTPQQMHVQPARAPVVQHQAPIVHAAPVHHAAPAAHAGGHRR